ncbi:hypothetical protein BASA81_017466 [Batrachochytrium salamandrivorans]|nr:hypothetical protein BASA81_017466 [Batrachochytrium salamandrivorans]
MANSDISVPSVDHRQEPSTSTTFSIYGLAAVSISLPPLHSRSNPGSPDGACLQDRSPYHKTRCSIPHNGPRRPTTKHHPAPRAPKQANPLAYSAKLPTSPSRPASTNSPTSTTITADPRSQCCQYQQQTTCYSAISSGTPGSGPSQRPASLPQNFALLSLDSMSSSIQPRDLDAEESPSVSHRALVAMNMRLQRIVHSWGHGLTVMQFSGSQITRLSTVHGRRHSSIDHFVCNAPARALSTSPRVDRQTAVADHFVIRTSIRAEAQGQPPVPRAPTISRHHCLEAT